MIPLLELSSKEIGENLCDLPEVCLIKILRYVGQEDLEEVKLSCNHIYGLLYSQKILRRIHHVKVKLSECPRKNQPSVRPPRNSRSVENECSCVVEIEEAKTLPQHGEHGRRLTFKHNTTVEVKRNTKGFFRTKTSFDRNMEWTTEENSRFRHHCLAAKIFFEWMAKEYRQFTITRFHIETSLDSDSLRCWDLLARVYGIRAIHAEYRDGDDDPKDAVEELLRPFKLSSLRYFMRREGYWSTVMQSYISSLNNFEGIKYLPHNTVHFDCGLFKFPPRFIVQGGVQVTAENVGMAIRRWYNGTVNLKHLEELRLVNCNTTKLAEQIALPHSRHWFRFADIVIHKTGSDPLLLRSAYSQRTGFPRTWRIYTSLSWRRKLEIFFVDNYMIILPCALVIFIIALDKLFKWKSTT